MSSEMSGEREFCPILPTENISISASNIQAIKRISIVFF